MNKMKSSIKLYLFVFFFIIIAITLYVLFNKDKISVTNIRWDTNSNICNVSFIILNESQKSYSLKISIKLFTFERPYSDQYTLIESRDITLNISSKEKRKIEESIPIEVMDIVKQAQVILISKNEL